MGTYLRNEIGKKFDGDYDVLWAAVKEMEIPNQGRLRGLLASHLQALNGAVRSMEEIEQVPLLQIALPVGFEDWDGATPIKVAYTPLTIDDVDVREIYAYDHSGQEYVLDGQTPPDFPVMVVGINERVSMSDQSLKKGLVIEPPEEDDPPPPPEEDPPPPSTKEVTITQVDLDRDANYYEPWFKGDAELYFRLYDPYAPDYSEWDVGHLAPDNDYKPYELWKWDVWHYVQTKPWRTINLLTHWSTSKISNANTALRLRLLEYDWPYYTLGESSGWWCLLFSAIGPGDYWIGTAIGLALMVACILDNYDDEVGIIYSFNEEVSLASLYPCSIFTVEGTGYKIKFRIE